MPEDQVCQRYRDLVRQTYRIMHLVAAPRARVGAGLYERLCGTAAKAVTTTTAGMLSGSSFVRSSPAVATRPCGAAGCSSERWAPPACAPRAPASLWRRRLRSACEPAPTTPTPRTPRFVRATQAAVCVAHCMPRAWRLRRHPTLTAVAWLVQCRSDGQPAERGGAEVRRGLGPERDAQRRRVRTQGAWAQRRFTPHAFLGAEASAVERSAGMRSVVIADHAGARCVPALAVGPGAGAWQLTRCVASFASQLFLRAARGAARVRRPA